MGRESNCWVGFGREKLKVGVYQEVSAGNPIFIRWRIVSWIGEFIYAWIITYKITKRWKSVWNCLKLLEIAYYFRSCKLGNIFKNCVFMLFIKKMHGCDTCMYQTKKLSVKIKFIGTNVLYKTFQTKQEITMSTEILRPYKAHN